MYTPEDFNYDNAPKEMVQYVIDTVEDFDARYARAWDIIGRYRCPLKMADECLYDNIYDTFDLCNQTVGEISEQEALEIYSYCTELPFDLVDNDTPDGLYVNLF